jgi:hypothetical protein
MADIHRNTGSSPNALASAPAMVAASSLIAFRAGTAGKRRPEFWALASPDTVPAMSDYVIPDPEPKPIDEKLSMELRILADNAVLKGKPSGEEKCENCLYYLEPTADISYCWHQKLRILVGADWWCQWWEKIPE